MADVRGNVYRWKHRIVPPTYHPAFLLRTPEYKRDVWNDVQGPPGPRRRSKRPPRPGEND